MSKHHNRQIIAARTVNKKNKRRATRKAGKQKRQKAKKARRSESAFSKKSAHQRTSKVNPEQLSTGSGHPLQDLFRGIVLMSIVFVGAYLF